MLPLYLLATLLSALLLFTVEPMVAKMLLPLLGGSPAVWNTCMLFYQAVLLAGYAYAHLLSRRLATRTQAAVHAAVLALPILLLPLGLPRGAAPPGGGSPIPWTLGTLLLAAGAPFFVLSTTGPLLQRWFAASGHGRARDPYFLYAASNAGSLVGLLLYPLALEPLLPLRTPRGEAVIPSFLPLSQSTLWSLGYIAFTLAAVACALAAARRARAAGATSLDAEAEGGSGPAPAWRTRLLWVALALVPSSALLGTTQYVTSDIAAIPLLWVVPLALYLLTFVLAFSPRWRFPARHSGTVLAVLATLVAASLLASVRARGWLLLPLHLATLFAVGLTCHRRLAEERPHAGRLTEFYLLVAVGGALGGVFNALLAPVMFRSVAEYPIALVAACLLRPRWVDEASKSPTVRSRALDAAVPLAFAGLLFVLRLLHAAPGTDDTWGVLAVRAGGPALLALALVGWRLRFALALAVLLVGGWVENTAPATSLHRERTFFGIHRVATSEGLPFKLVDSDGHETFRQVTFHLLIHGATRHGSQALDSDLRAIPTTYYHPTGPIGQVFSEVLAEAPPREIGLVGLGAGTLAAYGRPGQRFTYFEIDPAVIRIARDPRFFTYIADSKAAVLTIPGDGRLSLAREPDGKFGLIVLDAFSSDAIPVHLLTREAVGLYFRKLAPDGILAIHLTNTYMRLEPVVGAVASSLGLEARVQRDAVVPPKDAFEGKDGSIWAVVARDPARIEALVRDPRWLVPPADPRYLWTDDYSNVLGVLRLQKLK
ncbi:MAG: fused MFS/spermidine synthase [Acidobacteriia bacterium]|nr:fused MFS/spermidine synthase [Terriglobia bacterium]